MALADSPLAYVVNGGRRGERITMGKSVFNIPSWDGQRRSIAYLWSLSKGAKTSMCELHTHPLGAEVRVEVGGDVLRSEAGRDPLTLIERALEWNGQLKQDGWSSK